MNKVKLSVKTTYGRNRFFPECDVSRMIMAFMKSRISFTEDDVEIFVSHGWQVILVDQPPNISI
jgi:hypothetical protein